MFRIDITPPTVIISYPRNDDYINGTINILGSVFDTSFEPDLESYTIEYGRGISIEEVVAWTDTGISEVTSNSVIDSIIAKWDVSNLVNGRYILKLNAEDNLGHTSEYFLSVNVISASKEVFSRQGDHVIGANQEFDLYIPPNSISKDVSVYISKIEESEIVIKAEQEIIFKELAYNIFPSDLTLLKPGSLIMKFGSNLKNNNNLAIFHLINENGEWERVGGTVNKSTCEISTAITRFGVYGLFEDLGVLKKNFNIRNINCQPRVLSPKGGWYDNQTAISFELGRAMYINIDIFNQAGRFVRRLVNSRMMNAGFQVVTWDGRDGEERICPSGIYIVKIEGGGTAGFKTVGILNK